MTPKMYPQNKIGDILYSEPNRGRRRPTWIVGVDKNFQKVWIEYDRVSTQIL